jgi:O-succinylbenzoic acid--CoA ligase
LTAQTAFDPRLRFCAWPPDGFPNAGPEIGLLDADGAGSALTWDEVDASIARVADRLLAQGLRAGHLLALDVTPGLDPLILQLALPRVGAALFPVGEGQDRDALMGAAGAEWIWEGSRLDAGRIRPSGMTPPDRDRGVGWPSPLALVVATSGTSGAPRAAMLTASNLIHSARSVNAALGFGRGDCWLCCLPLSHVGGLAIVYRCALAGGTLVRRARFSAAAVHADLGRHRITHVSLVPAMLAALLEQGPPPASLRVALIGGQGLSPALAGRAIAAGWPVYLSYGMTETASTVAISPRLSRVPDPGRVGRLLPGFEIDCPHCGVGPGPLALRGPGVMAGYANPERRPGEGLCDGWLTTADLGCLDHDGVLQVQGRADQALVTGGVKVHPARIEGQLSRAPGVEEALVVGVDDPVWGARVVVVYTGDADPADLEAWCRRHLSGAERPRRFVRLAELPRLESGKPDRRRARTALIHPDLALAQPARRCLE